MTWIFVPEEPTEEQMRAGSAAWSSKPQNSPTDRWMSAVARVYRAMVKSPVKVDRDFQWKTIDGWFSANGGTEEDRARYARGMADSIGLGYRELVAIPKLYSIEEAKAEVIRSRGPQRTEPEQ